MLKIDIVENQLLALELLKRNALIAIIHEVTGISKTALRDCYRDMYGRSSQKGKPKESTKGLTRTLQAYKEATVFAVYFKVVNVKIQANQIRKVIIAFDNYKALYPQSRLDFSGTWVIAKELSDNVISLIRCECGAAVLINVRDELDDRCLVCKSPKFGI